MRCFVARGLHPDATTVVGIATERYKKGSGYSLDLAHIYLPTWSHESEQTMRGIQSDLGYFKNPRETPYSEDEYPQQDPTGLDSSRETGDP